MSFAKRLPALSLTIIQVILICPEEEMIWIHTGWHIASVKDLHADRNISPIE